MSRSRFPIRVGKSVGLSALAALGLVGGCGLAETQPDERLASVEKAAPASSLKVLAGSAVSQSDGSYDLHGGFRSDREPGGSNANGQENVCASN